MSIKIATFNAENLFTRPTIMCYADWQKGKDVLQDVATMTSLINGRGSRADAGATGGCPPTPGNIGR